MVRLIGILVLIGTFRSFSYDSASILEYVWTLAWAWQPSFFGHMQVCRASYGIIVFPRRFQMWVAYRLVYK